jgi:hypothetical protein
VADDQNQLDVFHFLMDHFKTLSPFTKDDMKSVTTWTDTSFNTYWSKQFRPFVVPIDSARYRVSESFRRYATWETFKNHVTQVRRVSAETYTALIHDNIIVFEFFMPLTNENHLRVSLNALFYSDTLVSRLKSLARPKLEAYFPPQNGEGIDGYYERVAKDVGERFGGYSVSHVSGRFRAAPVASHQEAASLEENGGTYLIDETTAIVKFIFPCGKPRTKQPPLTGDFFENLEPDDEPDQTAEAEAKMTRWLFGALFVQSIVQVVNGEAEIWMVESGMRSRLHIWRVLG